MTSYQKLKLQIINLKKEKEEIIDDLLELCNNPSNERKMFLWDIYSFPRDFKETMLYGNIKKELKDEKIR